MRGSLRWAGFLLLLAIAFPITGADVKKKEGDKKPDADKKKDDKKKEEPKQDPKDQMVFVAQTFAKMVKVENGLKLTFHVLVFEGGKLVNKDNNKDYDYELAENVKVRTKEPPVVFDEKGRQKVYTKEELLELKGGDPKSWGYQSDLEILQPGQIIQVFLGRKRSAPRTDPPVVTTINIWGEPM